MSEKQAPFEAEGTADRAQHTPGPWEAIQSEYSYGFAIQHSGSSIAAVWPENLRGQTLPSQANARLIAAAPDLLEALEAEMADLEEDIRWSEDSDLARLVERRNRALAAIVKAKGGAA